MQRVPPQLFSSCVALKMLAYSDLLNERFSQCILCEPKVPKQKTWIGKLAMESSFFFSFHLPFSHSFCCCCCCVCVCVCVFFECFFVCVPGTEHKLAPKLVILADSEERLEFLASQDYISKACDQVEKINLSEGGSSSAQLQVCKWLGENLYVFDCDVAAEEKIVYEIIFYLDKYSKQTTCTLIELYDDEDDDDDDDDDQDDDDDYSSSS